jgi:thiamine-monophosphate kinase
VIEGVHFLPDARGQDIGHKALGRVLSDLAAMGGEPLWILVNLVAPRTAPVAHIESIYRGMARLARRYGVAIVGGDTSCGNVLEIHVFAVGRVPRGKALLRSGAKAGEALYVTGALGGSGYGRHLRFDPRLVEGQWLRESGLVTAMMDVSDGVATDVRRLAAASGVGVVLSAGSIPISRAVKEPAPDPSKEGLGVGEFLARYPRLQHALADGEDFELLFTVPRRKTAAFEAAWRKAFRLACTRIGELTAKPSIIELGDGVMRKELMVHGYEHFCSHLE